MATQGTGLSGFYRRAFERVGFVTLEPSAQTQRRNVDRAIFLAKAGRIVEARSHARAAADELFDRGVSRIVLACTELPFARAPAQPEAFLDATLVLARSCGMEVTRGGETGRAPRWERECKSV